MSATKAITIVSVWAMAAAAFFRYVEYVDDNQLGPSYFRWPVALLVIGGFATFWLIREEP